MVETGAPGDTVPRPVAPLSVAPRSVTPRSGTPRSDTPRSGTPQSVVPLPVAARAGARPEPPRIVVISASVGAGHDGAADELIRRMLDLGFRVDRHDFLDLMPRRSGQW